MRTIKAIAAEAAWRLGLAILGAATIMWVNFGVNPLELLTWIRASLP